MVFFLPVAVVFFLGVCNAPEGTETEAGFLYAETGTPETGVPATTSSPVGE